MYLIVMAIGITALSYQLIEYKNTRKASSKKEEQTSARPKSGFKVKDPSKKVVVVNRNVSSRAPENKNE